MGFQNFVDALIVIGGYVDFFARLGGISFLVFIVYLSFKFCRHWPLSEREQRKQCESCQSYDTCAAVMEDCLPDYACAYWKKKKP